MKPANLLVFNDGRVKVGDLGTSIKLEPTIPNYERAYLLKGLTEFYSDDRASQAFHNQLKLDKNELLQADKISLMLTLEDVLK